MLPRDGSRCACSFAALPAQGNPGALWNDDAEEIELDLYGEDWHDGTKATLEDPGEESGFHDVSAIDDAGRKYPLTDDEYERAIARVNEDPQYDY